jgi:hypothetical protein
VCGVVLNLGHLCEQGVAGTFPLSWASMLLASRLSEMHALEVQTLPAEPAGTGGRVAAGPPAPGPVLEPEVHDAASATTPSATTQIRLTTADLPAPPTA